MGAESTTPLGPASLAERVATREPFELEDLPRAKVDDDDLTRDGWDWHPQETRLVEAWALLGGPDHIDWKHVRVGQLDTGFRPIPALGFATPDSERSDFVLTDLDRNFCPATSTMTRCRGAATFASGFSAKDPLLGGPFDGTGPAPAACSPATTRRPRRPTTVPRRGCPTFRCASATR